MLDACNCPLHADKLMATLPPQTDLSSDDNQLQSEDDLLTASFSEAIKSPFHHSDEHDVDESTEPEVYSITSSSPAEQDLQLILSSSSLDEDTQTPFPGTSIIP